MVDTSERAALHRLYATDRTEGVPPFLRDLYPKYLHYWQYLGTGGHKCEQGGPCYNYVPAEDPESPLNYALEIHWPGGSDESPGVRTALYRLRDESNRLLYVGISEAPLRRWPEHASDKEWWPEVASFSLEWFESRGSAHAAEVTAIRTEAPKYNVAHKTVSL